jgi:hypothetical protein
LCERASDRSLAGVVRPHSGEKESPLPIAQPDRVDVRLNTSETKPVWRAYMLKYRARGPVMWRHDRRAAEFTEATFERTLM